MIINPATEEAIADVPADSPAGVADKRVRERAAQPAWARVAVEERLTIIAGFRDARRRARAWALA